MRKCHKCQIVFHLDDRVRCLYCDSLLMSANDEQVASFSFGIDSPKSLLKDIIRDRKCLDAQGKLHILGSYFRVRSLPFIYMFSRNELKMDKAFKRFFVQPLNMSFLLTFIPWLIIDMVDSLFFRLIYQGYCKECNWKYKQISQGQITHDPEECAYNKEYSRVIDCLLNGEIAQREEEFVDEANKKFRDGKKSAYHDLCSRKKDYQGAIDVASIWLSGCLIVYIFALLTVPFIMKGVKSLDDFNGFDLNFM